MRSFALLFLASSDFDNSTERRVPDGGVPAGVPAFWAFWPGEFAVVGSVETCASDVAAKTNITNAKKRPLLIVHSLVCLSWSLLVMMRPARTRFLSYSSYTPRRTWLREPAPPGGREPSGWESAPARGGAHYDTAKQSARLPATKR